MTKRFARSPIVVTLCCAWSCGFFDDKAASSCNDESAFLSTESSQVIDNASAAGATAAGADVIAPAPTAGSLAPPSAVVTGSAPTNSNTAGTGAVAMTPAAGSAAGATAMAGRMAAGAGAAAGTPASAAGGGGALAPGALQCPKEACAALPEPSPDAAAAGFDIKQCCSPEGECGTSLNGAACMRTPDSFAGCPSLDVMGFMVPSCCSADGKCGIDASVVMMGCLSLEDLALQAGAFLTVPAPAPCTPMTM
jgi:hypothetical protein